MAPMSYIFVLLSVVTVGCTADSSEEVPILRRGRQMFNRLTSYKNREKVELPLCQVDDTVGACLKQAECRRERGLFAGYCDLSDNVCCVVDNTCGGSTKAHHSYFRNPSYPEDDDDPRPCTFTVEIGREVCAVRLNFDRFQLAAYEDGVCIRDTLTILGTKDGPTTPVCGNMTNWSTTFAVESRSTLSLAMVLQGEPDYKFSISVTQLACDDIEVFHSPTYAGIRNADAPKYDRPTTTTTSKPKPEEGEEEEEEEEEEGEEEEESTTVEPTEEATEAPKVEPTTRSAGSDDDDDDDEDDKKAQEPKGVTDRPSDDGEDSPTTLTPGKIPKPEISKVVIKSESKESDEGVWLETADATPAISAFKRAFDLRVNDRCWLLEVQSPATFRVIGGSYTGINEYPWQVALVYNKKFFCGGSLISDRHILTAAHCVFGSFSKGLDYLRVSLGDHDLTTKNETKNIVSKVKHIFWHLHYNPHTTEHDIALMELEEPVPFTYGVSAVKLPADLDDMYEEQNATVTGWGRYTIKTKATSPVMKEYTGPLMKTSKCVAAWNMFPGISARAPNNICLDVKMGTPCHGDSGGPLVTCSGVQCTQIGVVSFGFPLCTNVGLPAVFTRVSHYKGWIDMSLAPLDVVSQA